MDERRCDVISIVEASDCRGGVAVSICNLEAVAAERAADEQGLQDNILLIVLQVSLFH